MLLLEIKREKKIIRAFREDLKRRVLERPALSLSTVGVSIFPGEDGGVYS